MSELQWSGIDNMRGGPLFRLAGNASLQMRRRAYEWVRERVGGFAGKLVLDHGATPDTTSIDSNCHLPWLLEDGATVYAASAENIDHLEQRFAGLVVVPWPPGPHLPRRADVVFSSSVIAHVGERDAQLAFVRELLDLGDRVYLTTPNRKHWLEFHTKIPLLHWLPRARYHVALRALGLGFWTHLNLLSQDELADLIERAAAGRGAVAELQWYEPRLLGRVSNLVVLITQVPQ